MENLTIEIVPAANAVGHSLLQLAVAVPLSVTLDWAFDAALQKLGMHVTLAEAMRGEAVLDSPLAVAKEALELAAQVTLFGMVAGLIGRQLVRLDVTSQDPAAGAVFITFFFGSAPLMQERLKRLIEYAHRELMASRSAVNSKMANWATDSRTEEITKPGTSSQRDAVRMQQTGVYDPQATKVRY